MNTFTKDYKKKEKDFFGNTEIYTKLFLQKIYKIISIQNFSSILYRINGIRSRKFNNIKNI